MFECDCMRWSRIRLILAMYFVGGMMKNKTLKRKAGSKMTEGMIMPYKKVIAK